MSTSHPIIMLSGMGADERVFTEQLKTFPNMSVPAWIDPLADESLASYAKRFAHHINPGGPCIIGGASFGGFVALEMLPWLEAEACMLIGSARGPEEFPPALRALKKAVNAVHVVPFEVASLLSKAALASRGNDSDSQLTALLSQVAESDAAFMRWACKALLEWPGYTGESTKIAHIHGEKDPVLPAKHTNPDVIVAGAGHAISMSHPHEVSGFIETITLGVAS